MEFVKVYKTRVPNAARTLDRKIEIEQLMKNAKSASVRSALAPLLERGSCNFWDFGVRASLKISANSHVKIICGSTCYTGVVIHIISDPGGEIGDLLGWVRMYNGTPWKNVCALTLHSSSPISKQEVDRLVGDSTELDTNFYHYASSGSKSDGGYMDGGIVELTLTAFERDPAARRSCLAHYGTKCQICYFDFGDVYGKLGTGFIHVHHVIPLSKARGAHFVDPIKDLIPVCPNCHAMLHINQGDPIQIDQLKEIVNKRKHGRLG